MEDRLAKTLCDVLGLSHMPVGVRFVSFESEYDSLSMPELESKKTVCGMLKRAYDGELFKATSHCFSCDYGRCALGIGEPFHHAITEGRSFDYCGLFENYMVAHSFMRDLCYCKHKVYGVVMGPLQAMGKADVVAMVVDARQAMRLMQGYVYKYGAVSSLSTNGVQAACSDLIAKVVESNEANISLMCRGARTYTHCSDGEMGFSLPAHLFPGLVEGVVETITPVEHDPVKRAILDRLSVDDPIRDKIVLRQNYSKKLDEYDDYIIAQGQ